MLLRDGPDVLLACGGTIAGLAAYVFLRSVHPLPENVASALAYVLFAGIWILASAWFWKQVFIWRKIQITTEKVTEERFFALWLVRTNVIRLDGKYFTDFADFSSGFPVSRPRTLCFFAGPGCRISVTVHREQAQEIK